MIKRIDKNAERTKRHKRIRNKISGTAQKPRFCVYRSSKHIYVQVIDDVSGKTLVAASTMEKTIAEAIKEKTKSEAAAIVGKEAAKRTLEAGISEVVFDRGGYLYAGRVANVASGAREAGLQF
ncbi:MAG: 50S ribosomal protein L18 [Clostridia bacterium]|nr:50S ribosomal protein L18 [Clostridia bacterium]